MCACVCTFACLQFDGMQPNYFHFGCFFKNGNLPTSTADIEGFELLRLEDQKKIEDKLTKVCVHVCMCMCVCVHVCVCVCVCVCTAQLCDCDSSSSKDRVQCAKRHVAWQ